MRAPILRLSLGAVLALALFAVLGTPGSSARLRRSVVQRAAVLPRGDRALGALAAGRELRGAVVLRPRDPAALSAFIAAVSDPGSARYGDYLRAGTFAARFGPTAATRAAVARALRADGLHVSAASSDGLLVPFSGTTLTVQHAFDTTLRAVALAGGGRGTQTIRPVSLPASLAGSVTAVVGLDETARPQRIASPRPSLAAARRAPRVHGELVAARADAGTAGPHACPAATAAALQYNGLTDDAVAGAYGASGLYAAGDTGAGQHIAIYELEPFLRSDVATFDTCYFGATQAAAMLSRLHVVDVDGGPPTGTGSGEASLDVEDISALAPGADIDVYTGPSANAYDSLDEYAAIVDQDRDRVVSTSWGECEQALERGGPGEQAAENVLFQQAAAQGQTIFAASGDNGSDDCNAAESSTPVSGQNPVSVDDPASQPYVVGVGGTALTDADPGQLVEHAWNDGAAYGAGGGGISTSWAMPAWQRGARVPGIALPGSGSYRTADQIESEAGFAPGFCQSHAGVRGGTPCRLVPDVSAQADEFTGAITVYSREYVSKRDPTGWSTIGGTSSAAPIWAAAYALAGASAECSAARQTRAGLGFASPLLYGVASDPADYAASFTDVTAGDNDIYGLADGRVFAAARGYDMATGLGSPRLTGPGGTAGLADALCSLAGAGARPAVTGLSPHTGSSAGGETLTVHGSGFTSGGHAQVGQVQIGDTRIGGAHVQVLGAHTLRVRLPPADRGIAPATAAPARAGESADVSVTLRDGMSSAPDEAAVFRYLDSAAADAVPTVQAISPSGGNLTGGNRVTVFGTGFANARTVTIGGRRVPFRVQGGDRLTLTAPRRTGAVACVALPDRGVWRGKTPGNDICQVYVRVLGAHGASPRTPIRPPYEGSQATDADGDVSVPAGCGCEVAAAADEYDYVPEPHIDAVSTDQGPGSLASEHGGTVVTLHGSGLDPFTLAYATFGDPRRFASEAGGTVYATGTELQVRAPRQPITADAATVAVAVRTLGGLSNRASASYAGRPVITRVSVIGQPRTLDGVSGAPDTGGAPLRVSGTGLGGQVLGVEFIEPGEEPFSLGTQYTFEPLGSSLLTRTVSENPAELAVEACTVTGCTRPGTGNRLWLYQAGTPTVSAVSPAAGPAAGGGAVTIAGSNLGCALEVRFGVTPSPALTPLKTLLPCGSSQTLTATAPPGVAGTTVPVSVETVGGYFAGVNPISLAGYAYP